jgi:hypothetical protein
MWRETVCVCCGEREWGECEGGAFSRGLLLSFPFAQRNNLTLSLVKKTKKK